MKTYKNFVKGLAIVPKSSSESDSPGEMEILLSDGKLYIYNDGINANDAVVQETVSATLTNKVLTGNTAANLISGSGTLVLNTTGTMTVPNGTDTIVTLDLLQTLTNKTISGSSNTLSNIGNASLTNSSITINGSSVSLGGSITVSASTTSTLTIGTGLSGGSFDGSAPVTIAIDSTVATLTGNQVLTNKTLTGNTAANLVSGSGTLTLNTSGTITIPNGTLTLATLTGNEVLTNKTLTSPVINTATADTITGIAAGTLALVGASNQQITLTTSGAGLVDINNIQINGSNQIISTASSDLEFRAKTGYNTKINCFTGSVLLQNNNNTQATVTTTGITLASGKTLVLTNNSQTTTIQSHASASASYTITTPAAAPTANTAWVYNGTTYVWSAAGGWTHTTSASLGASGTISISLTIGQQVIDVASSSGAVTLSTTPFGSSAPNDGTVVRLIGGSDTNTVQIINNDAQYGCIVNGAATLKFGYVIEFQYLTGYERWFETMRNF